MRPTDAPAETQRRLTAPRIDGRTTGTGVTAGA